MLSELIRNGFGEDKDLNCAEKILYGANEAYKLGLDKQALKLSAGFGGGMGIEDVCGVLTAAVMVLSIMFVKDNAHGTPKIKLLTKELFDSYKAEMSDIRCTPLKALHRTEELKCKNVILKAAEILDRIVKREAA